jgi:hypothetical protein
MTKKKSLFLARLSTDAALYAESDALWLRYEGAQHDLSLARHRDWEHLGEPTTSGRELAPYVEQLVESELAEAEGPDVRLDYFDLDKIDQDYDFFKQVVPWAPFYLVIDSDGALGTPDFQYRYHYHLGSIQVFPRRFGCFLERAGQVYRMDYGLFRLVATLDEFNQRRHDTFNPAETKAVSLKTLHEIQKLAKEVGARLDSYLQQEQVVCPEKVQIGVSSDPQGRISFFPIFPTTGEAESLQAFLKSGSIPSVYDIVKPDGSRTRVLVDEPIKEVLEKMLRVRHVTGRTKAQVLGDPFSVLEGADLEVIDLEGYGPRVRAIGNYPKEVRAYVRRQSLGFLDPSTEAGLVVTYPDGSQKDLTFTSPGEAEDLLGNLEEALKVGEPTVSWCGTELPATPELIQGIREALIAQKPPEPTTESQQDDQKKSKGRASYLIIYTNEPEKDFEYPALATLPTGEDFFIPRALTSETLKKHQQEGVNWLVRLFNHPHRRGALLADEMGLGKTLQILAFLAWYLETQPQPKPALIVTPLILLENETWLQDIQAFFYAKGAVFDPVFTLYGQNLARCRELPAAPGKETQLGEAILRWRDLAKLRVILTNYQTVVNYQFSLGKIDWGLLITDEGQYFKEPKTLVSRAMKSLKADFRITLTGTPVENSLLDFWNLMDFLQPGLLDSARTFAREYIDGVGSETAADSKMEVLRREVGVNRPHGFVLRRAKEEVLDLPPKHEVIIDSFLSEEQRQAHLNLISQAAKLSGGRRGAQLVLLHELVKLYQHPWLMQSFKGAAFDWKEVINSSPKLKSVMECLDKIKDRREKVIVFARFRQMQAILQNVTESRFQVKVDVINGSASPRTGRTKYNRQERLEEFQQSPGFQAIILSPQVAGIGLNIVAANHVVHYGRWWNPAQEDQATDRVHRIGQSREVFVYFPISRDPLQEFSSFDEKLNQLLLDRKKLRRDFLAPGADEEALGTSLYKKIIEEQSEETEDVPLVRPDALAQLSADEFECVIASLLSKMNFRVFLTPFSSDGGVDVVALNDDQLLFVECKHLSGTGTISLEAVNQLLDGYDYYSHNIIPTHLRNKGSKLILVTNKSFDNNAKIVSKDREVELWSFTNLSKMLNNYTISVLDVKEMEIERYTNLVLLKKAFEKISL